jgi:hypothetical protein
MEQMNFSVFAENRLFVIEEPSLIKDKYKQIISLGETYKFIYDNKEIFHRVSNEDYELCKETVSKIMKKIKENIQFCSDEYNLNIHTPEQKQKIFDIIQLMDVLKYELEKISPLDFIIEVNNQRQQEEQEEEEQEQEEEEEQEYLIGPYDDLNCCENCKHLRLYYEYEGYDGYDGYDN